MKLENLVLGAMIGIGLISAGSVLAEDKANTEAKSPKQVCEALVEAAKKDDFEGFNQWTTSWRPGRHMNQMAGTPAKTGKDEKMEQGFHPMHKEHMQQMKDLTCGDEHVAGTHAFVDAESKGGKRLIPFVQKDGAWRFDAHTYMSFYRDTMLKGMGHGMGHGMGRKHGKGTTTQPSN